MRTASPTRSDRGERLLAIDWRDCAWQPRIGVGQKRHDKSQVGSISGISVAEAPVRPLPFECNPLLDPAIFKTMKNLTAKDGRWPQAGLDRASAQPASGQQADATCPASSCHVSPVLPSRTAEGGRVTLAAPKRLAASKRGEDGSEGGRLPRAFTLVELLTVIAIIAILAAMLFPALAAVKKHALKVRAHTEVLEIANAIEAYDSAYGRFPVSTNAQFAASGANSDFTYGWNFDTPTGPLQVPTFSASGVIQSNAEVVAILMSVTNYPNGQMVLANLNYRKNPQQTIFLTPKVSGYDPSAPGPPEGGVDINGVYRDPWGNPYVISMDLNYDESCKDSFYCLSKVSNPAGANSNPGLNGLVNPDTSKSDNFQYHGKVMVWSAGPDGQVDPNNNVNLSANKDNVLSWK